MPDISGIQYIGGYRNTVLVAGDCFIDPETFQIFNPVICTLKFKVFPRSVFHDQIKILKKFLNIQTHQFSGGEPYHLSGNMQKRKNLLCKKLHHSF